MEMEFHCPHCQSPIYSRKNKLCGRCGKLLPPEMLFTEKQKKIVGKEMQDAKRRILDMAREHS